jgi:hypothetical protein
VCCCRKNAGTIRLIRSPSVAAQSLSQCTAPIVFSRVLTGSYDSENAESGMTYHDATCGAGATRRPRPTLFEAAIVCRSIRPPAASTSASSASRSTPPTGVRTRLECPGGALPTMLATGSRSRFDIAAQPTLPDRLRPQRVVASSVPLLVGWAYRHPAASMTGSISLSVDCATDAAMPKGVAPAPATTQKRYGTPRTTGVALRTLLQQPAWQAPSH